MDLKFAHIIKPFLEDYHSLHCSIPSPWLVVGCSAICYSNLCDKYISYNVIITPLNQEKKTPTKTIQTNPETHTTTTTASKMHSRANTFHRERGSEHYFSTTSRNRDLFTQNGQPAAKTCPTRFSSECSVRSLQTPCTSRWPQNNNLAPGSRHFASRWNVYGIFPH